MYSAEPTMNKLELFKLVVLDVLQGRENNWLIWLCEFVICWSCCVTGQGASVTGYMYQCETGQVVILAFEHIQYSDHLPSHWWIAESEISDRWWLVHRMVHHLSALIAEAPTSQVVNTVDIAKFIIAGKKQCILNGLNGSSKMVEKRAFPMRSQSGYRC